MDQPNGDATHPPKQDPDTPAQVSGAPSTSPSKQPADGSDSAHGDPTLKPDASFNGSDSKKASPTKSPKSVRWSEHLVSESTFTSDPPRYTSGDGSGGVGPYVTRSLSMPSSTSFKEKMEGFRGVLGRWGSNVKEAAKKAETLAENTWQHLKTSPSFTDAAMGRIAHTTKILAEGGYEKIFRQTFETSPDEQLRNTFACYLSTSAGPVMGALYLSSSKLAFCSDSPLPYKNGDQTEWSYYKVVIPLHQLKAVNPSSSRVNPAEKYIQIISVDNHEFWYMGFLNYEGAVTSLEEALTGSNVQSV